MIDRKIWTTDDLLEVLNGISFVNTSLDFKWTFEIDFALVGSGDGWLVNLVFSRIDTHTGQMGQGRSRKEFIAQGVSESGIVKTAWLLLEITIRHELMEGFHWKGARIFNPHNSVHDLASIQPARP